MNFSREIRTLVLFRSERPKQTSALEKKKRSVFFLFQSGQFYARKSRDANFLEEHKNWKKKKSDIVGYKAKTRIIVEKCIFNMKKYTRSTRRCLNFM